MKLRSLLIGAGLSAALAAIAIAQSVSVPSRGVITQADLIQVIPNGAPSAQSVYNTIPQITNVSGYYKSVPLTGWTYTFTSGVTFAAFNPAGTLATGFIYLSPSPSDGTRNCIFSTQAYTALTLYAASGQTLNNAVTSLSANTSACYLYSASNLTWDRS